MGGRSSGAGGSLNRRSESIRSQHVSEDEFMREASRQGLNGSSLQSGLEDYVESSYGGISLADTLSDFIENAPRSMMYNSGTLYRGLMFESKREFDEFLASNTEGSILRTRRTGMSWTGSENVAKEFAQGNYNVILINNDRNRIAMGIKNIADTPVSSDEVLYSNKVDFTISKVQMRGTTAYVYVKQRRKK